MKKILINFFKNVMKIAENINNIEEENKKKNNKDKDKKY